MTPLSPVTDKLEPCRECGAECRIETFEGPHIEGVVTLYLCSKHMRFGGGCPSTLAYFTPEAWNDRHNARDLSGGEVERARTSIEELEYIAGHETTPLVVAQAALRAKDVIAALSAMSRDDAGVVTRLVEALRPFAELRLSTEPEISDLVWRSHAAQLREQASAVELRDAQICKAREALSSVGYKENSDG